VSSFCPYLYTQLSEVFRFKGIGLGSNRERVLPCPLMMLWTLVLYRLETNTQVTGTLGHILMLGILSPSATTVSKQMALETCTVPVKPPHIHSRHALNSLAFVLSWDCVPRFPFCLILFLWPNCPLCSEALVGSTPGDPVRSVFKSWEGGTGSLSIFSPRGPGLLLQVNTHSWDWAAMLGVYVSLGRPLYWYNPEEY
jgi:hypothetical protein